MEYGDRVTCADDSSEECQYQERGRKAEVLLLLRQNAVPLQEEAAEAA